MTIRKYKLQARTHLKGKALRSFRLDIITAAVSVLSAATGLLINDSYPGMKAVFLQCLLLLISILFTGAFRQGMATWQFRAASGRSPKPVHILYWFNPRRAFHAMKLYIVLQVYKAIWYIALVFPGAMILYAVVRWNHMIGEPKIILLLYAIGAACVAVGTICAAIITQKYALCGIILAQNPTIAIKDAAATSQDYMTGHCQKLFCLKLSFLPHFLCCMIVLPIAYVLPYYRQTVNAMLTQINSKPVL